MSQRPLAVQTVLLTTRTLLFAVALGSVGVWSAACADQGCFTIIAGRQATAEGIVLFAHNEDNGPADAAGMRSVARATPPAGSWVTFPGGARIPQVDTTYAYWHLQMPDLDYSDAYINEHGVALASNSCPSRQTSPELIDGGVGGRLLRRLVAERARTAREGALLVGGLIERFGYTASGRTLAICDSQEGWLVAMVNGRHWVAARVPDDQVAVLANTYTIRDVDLSDADRFLAAPDLIQYAEAQGWHDPARGPFDFAAAYADPSSYENPDNTYRQWSGLRRVAAEPVPPPGPETLPFAATPRAPLRTEHLVQVLRDHYEGVRPGDARLATDGSPHGGKVTSICRHRTNSSSVIELYGHDPVSPRSLYAVWWLALWQPCTSPYVPLFPGLQELPDPLLLNALPTRTLAGDPVTPDAAWAYRVLGALARWVDASYESRAPGIRSRWRDVEQMGLEQRTYIVEELSRAGGGDPHRARQLAGTVGAQILDECLRVAHVTMEHP